MIILATLFLACSDVTAKYLSHTLPSIEIVWIRFLVFLLLLIPVMVRTSTYSLQSARPSLQIWRGIGLASSSLLFISSLRFLPMAEASATSFISPVLVTALSIPFLGEKVGFRRWVATVAGLIGVMIVVRPGSSAFHPAAILPLASALGWATALIITRMTSGKDPVLTTMFYSAVVGFCLLTVLVPFVWVTPTPRDILLSVGIGVAATSGQWIVVLAFRYADASVLAPFSYIQLVCATILGFLVFAEIPDIWTITGAAVIIGSGLYTAHRERLRRSPIAVSGGPHSGA